VPLARRAVERVTAAMLHMDDSSGIIGGDLRVLTPCTHGPAGPLRRIRSSWRPAAGRAPSRCSGVSGPWPSRVETR
jgi:hypothetical protein